MTLGRCRCIAFFVFTMMLASWGPPGSGIVEMPMAFLLCTYHKDARVACGVVVFTMMRASWGLPGSDLIESATVISFVTVLVYNHYIISLAVML